MSDANIVLFICVVFAGFLRLFENEINKFNHYVILPFEVFLLILKQIVFYYPFIFLFNVIYEPGLTSFDKPLNRVLDIFSWLQTLVVFIWTSSFGDIFHDKAHCCFWYRIHCFEGGSMIFLVMILWGYYTWVCPQ